MEPKIETISVVSEAVLQMNKAEMENAIDVAKRYPRDVRLIKAKVLTLATCDETTAKGCFFAKPVDNKGTIATGPSIRLAEIIAASYSNIKYGSRIIDIGEKFVRVQGMAIDLESNLSYTSEVTRSIWSDKGGYRYSQSLIETTTKAACAFAVRDAIFKVVPMGIFNSELQQIKETAVGKKSGEQLSVRVTKCFKAFEKLTVKKETIIKYLGVKNENEITEDHLETLIGLYNAIEENQVTVEEAFQLNKVNKEAKDANIASTIQDGLFDKDKKQ